ncbi:hypothetical protein [Thiomicrospira microaerophila]|uniref:hypothetical protein n=1 Tax=Thiomicrospira microaerophila TaxID=406020 RepID=UPI0005C9567C|nr:hypothetical protein [Thiomicrospira microaerophila]
MPPCQDKKLKPLKSPSQSDDSVSAMRADKTLKTHYQKGYISMPPYNDKCSRPKPVWIKPLIANTNSGESKGIQAKTMSLNS